MEIRSPYLPLGHPSTTTKVANEIFASGYVRQVKSNWGSRVLVEDDESEFTAFRSRIDTLSVGERSGEVDLRTRATEIGPISR